MVAGHERRIATIGLAIGILAVGAVGIVGPGRPGREQEKPPVAVFAALDGSWEGVFVGFDPKGQELYRIRVHQDYETIDATTQRVTLKDTMADGRVVTGSGVNTARRRPDGALELRCEVTKSNGDRVTHSGRLVRDAGGEEALVWWSQGSDRSETFLETVRVEKGREVYSIDGMGRYGETLILMQGRYHRSR